MDSAQRKALAVVVAAVVVLGHFDVATAETSSRKFNAVICTSDASGRWTPKAQGTLSRTKSERQLTYKFESAVHSFEWRFVTSREGHTTIVGPGFLMQQLDPAPKQAETPDPTPRGPLNAFEPPAAPETRRQSLETTGEIRETVGSSALALLIGSTCPRAKAALPRREP